MRKDRGVAFILAIILVAALTAVVVAAAATQRASLASRQVRMNERRARLAAESGLNMALSVLQNQDTNLLTDQDDWYEYAAGGETIFTMPEGSFRIQIIDAGSMINLNTISEEWLRNLPLTDEQIDCFLDWRGPELQPRPLGAKDEYYNQLTVPYNTKLGNFDTVDELLLVKGFNGATLLNPPSAELSRALTTGAVENQAPLIDWFTVDSVAPNLTADGQARLNINTAQAQALVQRGLSANLADQIVQYRNTRGTFATLGAVFSVPGITPADAEIILDQFGSDAATTVTGRLNINTVTEDILNSVPLLSPDVIQGILGRQGTFNTLGEVATVPGCTANDYSILADQFTIGSQAFVVRAMGQAGGTRVFLEAVVTLGTPMKIVRIQTPMDANPMTRWLWEDQPLREQSIEEEL